MSEGKRCEKIALRSVHNATTAKKRKEIGKQEQSMAAKLYYPVELGGTGKLAEG